MTVIHWLSAGALLASVGAAPAVAQETLVAPGPRGDLAGTLVAPAEGQPLVLIIPGSGPTDRDGNSPLGVTAAPYRLLADALAERGIGTLRIDKRGMFASKAAVADANAVTIADYVTDTASWVGAARTATGAECLWLLGHSEGGIVALAAAQERLDLGVVQQTAEGGAEVCGHGVTDPCHTLPLLVGEQLARPAPEHGAQLRLGVERDPVVDGPPVTVDGLEDVAALAVGVVEDDVEHGDASQSGRVLVHQRDGAV